jgi:hypothetical protein
MVQELFGSMKQQVRFNKLLETLKVPPALPDHNNSQNQPAPVVAEQ